MDKTFIKCEQRNVALLQSMGAVTDAYDDVRGGVDAILDDDTRRRLLDFPADFSVDQVRKQMDIVWQLEMTNDNAENVSCLVPTLDEVGLHASHPVVVGAFPNCGVVYISGTANSGTSLTMAALVRHTMEGHTNIRHQGGISIIQRATADKYDYVSMTEESPASVAMTIFVGDEADVDSFADGILYVKRTQPDLTVVGEFCDPETVNVVLDMANSGRLIHVESREPVLADILYNLATLFPESLHEQEEVFKDLIATAAMFVKQEFVPKLDGGHVVLREYLVVDKVVRGQMSKLIRCKQDIVPVMRSLVEEFGVTMATAAREAYDAGLISEATLSNCHRGADVGTEPVLVAAI